MLIALLFALLLALGLGGIATALWSVARVWSAVPRRNADFELGAD